ncbi:MAG: GH31, partial [uncultured Solirubrobacteraceae bacterium]
EPAPGRAADVPRPAAAGGAGRPGRDLGGARVRARPAHRDGAVGARDARLLRDAGRDRPAPAGSRAHRERTDRGPGTGRRAPALRRGGRRRPRQRHGHARRAARGDPGLGHEGRGRPAPGGRGRAGPRGLRPVLRHAARSRRPRAVVHAAHPPGHPGAPLHPRVVLALLPPLRLPARGGGRRRRAGGVRLLRGGPRRAPARARGGLRPAGQALRPPRAVGPGGLLQRLAGRLQADPVLAEHAQLRRLREHLAPAHGRPRRPRALRRRGHRGRRAAAGPLARDGRRAGRRPRALQRDHRAPAGAAALELRPVDGPDLLRHAGAGGDGGPRAALPRDPRGRHPRRHELVPRGLGVRLGVQPGAVPRPGRHARDAARAGLPRVAVAVAHRPGAHARLGGGARWRAPGARGGRRAVRPRGARGARRGHRLLPPGDRRVVPGQAAGPARPRGRGDQGRLRRGRAGRRPLPRRPGRGDARAVPAALQPRRLRGVGRRDHLGAVGVGGLPALPPALVGRRHRALAGPAARPALDPLVRPQRVPVLRPRHRRVLGHPDAEALRPLGPARAAVLARPRPRAPAPRAVGLRRAGRGHRPHLGRAARAAHPVPVGRGAALRGGRHPARAGAAARLPRRPRGRGRRRPVPARAVAARGARARRAGLPPGLPAAGPVGRLPHGRGPRGRPAPGRQRAAGLRAPVRPGGGDPAARAAAPAHRGGLGRAPDGGPVRAVRRGRVRPARARGARPPRLPGAGRGGARHRPARRARRRPRSRAGGPPV